MKLNYLLKDCKVSKLCFYCQKVGNYYRSLCLKKFFFNEESEILVMFIDFLMVFEIESLLLVFGK